MYENNFTNFTDILTFDLSTITAKLFNAIFTNLKLRHNFKWVKMKSEWMKKNEYNHERRLSRPTCS